MFAAPLPLRLVDGAYVFDGVSLADEMFCNIKKIFCKVAVALFSKIRKMLCEAAACLFSMGVDKMRRIGKEYQCVNISRIKCTAHHPYGVCVFGKVIISVFVHEALNIAPGIINAAVVFFVAAANVVAVNVKF